MPVAEAPKALKSTITPSKVVAAKAVEKKAETAPAKSKEYPSPDIRGPMPVNAHPDSTFSSHLHNDWTH